MTARKCTAIIHKLRIRELSFVDEGDNPGADIVIMKRRPVDTEVLKGRLSEAMTAAGDLAELAAGAAGDEGVEKAAQILGEMNMDMTELQGKLDQIEADLETVTKRADAAETRNTELESEVEKLRGERDEAVEKAKAAGTAVQSDEDIMKGLPEPVRKRLEDAERVAREAAEQVEKARDASELTEQVAKVRELGVKDADEIGGLLHRIAKGKSKPEDAAKVVEVLEVAKRVGDEGNKLFEAIGKAKGKDAPADDGEAAQAKLNEAMESIQKAKPGLTREQAYSEALEANPSLYEELRKIKPTAAAD